MKRLLAWGLALAACLAMLPAGAAYPDRPITLLLPSPPGGSADATARPLAKALGDILGQPVVVMNRPGAGGAIAYQQAANARPDGYTLLLGISTISVLPAADRLSERPPAYELEQFAPLALLTAEPLVLIVRADAPWQSVDELVAAAREAPEALRYASSGRFGPIHFPMEIFARAAGVKMLHVPYAGGAPAAAALLGGQVDVSAAGPAAAEALAAGGKVRMLAHWGKARIPQLPELPSLAELGYDAEYYLWAGLFGPAGMPADVRQRLDAAIAVLSRSSSFLSDMRNANLPVTFLEAEDFAEYWKQDATRMQQLTQDIGRVE